MDFDEYQTKAHHTAIYPIVTYNESGDGNFIYPLIGLGGEVGELQNKLKKVIRDNIDIKDIEYLEKIQDEIGDVLWYIAELCTSLNISLVDVASLNLYKLESRAKRNQIKGSGDNR